NKFNEMIADRDQAGGGAHRARVVNRPEIDRTPFAIICINNCNTGVTERSVDREHAHCRKLKIARRAFNTESTNSKVTVLLAASWRRIANRLVHSDMTKSISSRPSCSC